MRYQVKVTYKYPVDAINAEDALATIKQAIKLRFIVPICTGVAEIYDETGKILILRAVLKEGGKHGRKTT